jgi:hypothetical protein
MMKLWRDPQSREYCTNPVSHHEIAGRVLKSSCCV